MNEIKISFATINDIDMIMTFINDHWQKDHILSKNKLFFNFQYVKNKKVNFIVAKNQQNIIGILGFIYSSYKKKSDVFCALWKVLDNIERPLLGVELLKYLERSKNIKNIFSLGINEKNRAICKLIGFETNKLNHFVLLNSKIKNFKVAKITKNINFPEKKSEFLSNHIIKKIHTNELMKFPFHKFQENLPSKDLDFFLNRYFEHPIYKYSFYGVYYESNFISFYVTRVQKINNSSVLRIIDFYGCEKGIFSFSEFLNKLIIKNNYEYADFFNFFLNLNYLLQSGFYLIDQEKEDLIIPDYFNPFEQKNIHIFFFTNSNNMEKIKIFKGDGDQDRPS